MSNNAVRVLRNVRPWGGEASDIHIADGLVSRIVPAAAPSVAGPHERDGRGLLALPGFINAHAHLDKSWWGLPWQPYGGEGTTDGRIRHEREHRDRLGVPSLERTRAVLAEFIRHGTTAVRTHIDVDLGVGLRGFEAVREAAAEYGDAITLQTVAFPQDGVLRRPGMLDLLADAARQGADFIGGIDPAAIDRDPVGQLDGIFSIAAEHGIGIDLHLHDPAELGAFQFDLIMDRTERLGLAGKVNIAHGFALAQVDAVRRADLLARMSELHVTLTTVAPLGLPQLPLGELDAADVQLGLGTDGIRDLWSPYGTGDMLAVALQYARASGLVQDADLQRVVELVTRSAAGFVGIEQHDLAVGARADIVLVEAENPMDALVRTPPRALVLGHGRALWSA